MIIQQKLNRIDQLVESKINILSVYFTAGFPNLNDTVTIIDSLTSSGVDMIEIGIPFSDPLADGPIIQASSEQALKNGMSIVLLFEQLKSIRKSIQLPLILMGYLNPILQYGIEKFCKEASEIGIDGFIIPDLPLDYYMSEYRLIFEKYNIKNILLITPTTSAERIRKIDEKSTSFIYMVSSSSTTGSKLNFSQEQINYFSRIKNMNLVHPKLIGFGIGSKESFKSANKYANGVIIGSAFIKHISTSKNLKLDIQQFIKNILS